MFKKIWRQYTAVLLAIVLVFGNGGMAAAVGTESQEIQTESEAQQEIIVSEAETELPADDDAASDEVAEASESPAREEISGDIEAQEEPSVIEDGEITMDETKLLSDEIVIDEIVSESVPVDMDVLGFHGMDLSGEQWADKYEMTEVLATLPGMVEGIDCVEGEVIFRADTQEEAEAIADCYNAKLDSFEYGIGVLKLKTEVKAAVYCAAQPDNSLPPVYPNLCYSFSDDEDEPYDADYNAIKINDELYNMQGYLPSIDADDAWAYTKGKGITVAVVDSGIDYDHEDLRQNIVEYKSVVSSSVNPEDKVGHGTHCAGIIAAVQGNKVGVSGVAPEASLLPVQISNEGSIYTSDIIKALSYLNTRGGVDIISMSLGGPMYDLLYKDALDEAMEKGMVVVASAGNDGFNQLTYPAAYPGVIAVAATYPTENCLDEGYSNYGKWVDVSAPGTRIYSTVPKSETNPTGYGYKSGTSMACPAVAGTIALMLSSDADLRAMKEGRPAAVLDKLVKTGDMPVKSSYGSYKYPRVNAMGAISDSVSSTVSTPSIEFFDKSGNSISPNGKNIASGDGYYFTLSASPSYAKIYYTVNGVKPTAETGNLYEASSPFRMELAGNMKVQAIAVAGGNKSKLFSASYVCDPVLTGMKCYGGKSDMKVLPGKSIQLMTAFEPSYAKGVKCTWSCDDTTGAFKVDSKTGKVTCKKGTAFGKTAKVTATAVSSSLSCTYNVIASDDKTDGITLGKTELLMSQWAGAPGLTMTGYVGEADLVPKSVTGQFQFKSSNEKVATVDDKGHVVAGEKSGTANITVTANDGSGKKAVCKVKVANPIYDISGETSTGNNEIGNGCSIKIKTTINEGIKGDPYFTPTNKKIVWTSSDPSIATVSSSGVVKCNKNAVAGRGFTITAEAKDEFGAKQTFKFNVTERVRKLCVISGRGYKTSYSIKLAPGGSYTPSLYKLSVAGRGTSNTIKISNSNGEKVFVQGSKVIATGKGSSTVKYKMMDGGGATFTLRVTVK